MVVLLSIPWHALNQLAPHILQLHKQQAHCQNTFIKLYIYIELVLIYFRKLLVKTERVRLLIGIWTHLLQEIVHYSLINFIENLLDDVV
jgi:hypothetical protein